MCIYFSTVVRISFKHRSVCVCGGGGEGGKLIYGGRYIRASGMAPFSGPEIYLLVYFFILKYMNPPNVQTTV